MNLNDPSIIFAQPAGRQLGLPARDGHWHNHLAQPGPLVGNGTMVKSGIDRVNSKIKSQQSTNAVHRCFH